MSIKRYDVEPVDGRKALMVPGDFGHWVKYDDHVAEAARLQARERELQAALDELLAAINHVPNINHARLKARAALAAVSAETEDDDG